MENFRENYTKNYLQEVTDLLNQMEKEFVIKMDRFAKILYEARENKKAIFFMGNGGSAATASHFVGDLSKGTIVEGFPRFKTIALTDNVPNMLAWGNDSSYEDIFIEQLKNLMEPGDVVVGISGSGNSKNVVKAIDYANENGAISFGLLGYDGGRLLELVQESIHVPSFNMQQVEDIHVLVSHLLTSMIREEQKEAV
ncbi:MAG: D-sedoheptulose-7-phosphate isomerase [Candidatus Hodarchaeales archaeon]|jgi:D-sedoheptulose 7-phosphate isomerase